VQRESILDRILKPRGISVVFQPLLDYCEDGWHVHAFEALVRGLHGTNMESPEVLFEYVRRKSAERLVDRHCASAMRIAKFLEAHAGVARVHYPGLASHPQHALAVRQMQGFGGVVAVQVAGGYREAERVMSRLSLFTQAVSLGGVESLAAHAAAMWAGTLSDDALREAGIEPNLIRLSIGLEDADDLIEDLDRALSV